jgi:hypothetical protein
MVMILFVASGQGLVSAVIKLLVPQKLKKANKLERM